MPKVATKTPKPRYSIIGKFTDAQLARLKELFESRRYYGEEARRLILKETGIAVQANAMKKLFFQICGRTLGSGNLLKVERLPAKQQERVKEWFRKNPNLTYAAAAQRIQERFGVKVAPGSVHQFWQKHLAPEFCYLPKRPQPIEITTTIREGYKVIAETKMALPPRREAV